MAHIPPPVACIAVLLDWLELKDENATNGVRRKPHLHSKGLCKRLANKSAGNAHSALLRSCTRSTRLTQGLAALQALRRRQT